MTDRPQSIPITLPSRSCQRQTSSLLTVLRRFRRNRFWLLLFLWLAGALPELILHITVLGQTEVIFRSGLVLGPVFALASAMPVFLLCTALPSPKYNRAAALIYTGSLFLLYATQLIFFRCFGTFWSVQTLDGWSFSRFSTAQRADPGTVISLLVMALPLVVLVTVGKQLFSFRPLKHWRQHIPMAIFCVAVRLLSFFFLSSGLWMPKADLQTRVSQLGLLSSLRLELVRPTAEPVPNAPPTFSQPEPVETVPVTLPDVTPLAGKPVTAVDFALLAQQENNDAIASIHRYFAGKELPPVSSRTGLFQGNNLILISVEGLCQSRISQEQAPTLHRMLTQGILLSEYHAPQWDSPSDAAYALLTGTLPEEDTDSLELASDRFLPLTMAQQLIARGYRVWAFHSGNHQVCGEAGGLEAMGYEWLGCSPGALDRATELFRRDHPFHVYCDLPGLEDIEELEAALKLLLTRLDANDLLSSTVIVLCATETDTGSCLIWKQGITPEVIDSPTGPLDLLPTLAGLWGFDTDSRLSMGRDVFRDQPPLVCLPGGSWITDLAVFDADTKRVTLRTPEPVTDDYISDISAQVKLRFRISAEILELDYWQSLFG